MPNKMERFAAGARTVLSVAEQEAQRLGHGEVAPEHLMLAMVQEEHGIAGEVLRALGIEQARLNTLIRSLSKAPRGSPDLRLDLSPDTKRVLELAVVEVRRLGHHYLGTEHLLLALVHGR